MQLKLVSVNCTVRASGQLFLRRRFFDRFIIWWPLHGRQKLWVILLVSAEPFTNFSKVLLHLLPSVSLTSGLHQRQTQSHHDRGEQNATTSENQSRNSHCTYGWPATRFPDREYPEDDRS